MSAALDWHHAELYGVEPDYLHAAVGQMFVLVWRNETTIEGVAATQAALERMARERGEGFGLFTIVEPHAPLPPAEVREQLASLLGRIPWIKGSAVVFEGKGFRAAAVRSVVTGLTMLARQPYPHKVFGTVEEGARWLGDTLRTELNTVVDAAALLRAIAAVRAQHAPPDPVAAGA